MEISEIAIHTSGSSRYKVTVTSQSKHFGLLTYDLLRPDLERTMVLLRGDAIYGELSPNDRTRLDDLRELISDSERLDAQGRMASAKSLVRRIAARPAEHPGKAIAVDKFGPVPVMVVETDRTLKLPDEMSASCGLDSTLAPGGVRGHIGYLRGLHLASTYWRASG
jgi:hypothetical protein